jgi:hypothetical protein
MQHTQQGVMLTVKEYRNKQTHKNNAAVHDVNWLAPANILKPVKIS